LAPLRAINFFFLAMQRAAKGKNAIGTLQACLPEAGLAALRAINFYSR
jgi:hypothetical protein